MKDFLKFTLATVTGIILSSIVLFIISMVTLFGIMSASDTETIVKKNSVMMLDLNGTLVERTQEDPLGILSQLLGDGSNTYGLDDILSSIQKAKENENIKGIYLQANSLGTSYASLQEIRNALLDFKESGKFVIAYADSYTQGLYYLSSAADKEINEDDNLPILGLGDMMNVRKNVPKDKSGNIVAVYYASGEITDYPSSATSEDGIVGSKVIRDLRKLKDNDDVKAVVLRVNSPGGSAFASEQIWHAVKELKTKKPVIVSMGDYAASGGYYISCVADTIVAEPTTLTGSIGIFGMIPNVKGLTDKIGLSYDVVKTNKYADFGNIMRPFNEDEKSLLQMMITEGYDTFVTRCAEGRHMTKEAIEKIAEGRVWTGETAKELGLVDELGGIDKALDIAVAKAGIEGYTVVSYPEKQDFLSSLLDTKPTNYVESQLLKSKLGEYYQQFGLLKNLQEQSMIQARIPFELNIK